VNTHIILRALKKPCNCKGIKTKLLLSMPPTEKILAAIDDTPFGARIIALTDRCLGLCAYTPGVTTPQGNTRRIGTAEASNLAFEPYVKKVEQRASMQVYKGGVTHHKIVDWNLFTISKILYPGSQYKITKKMLDRVYRAQCQTINAPKIFEAKHTHTIFRALGITNSKNIVNTLNVTLIKAAIRQYGHTVLVAIPNTGHQRDATRLFDEMNFESIGPDARNSILTNAPNISKKELCIRINKAAGQIDLIQAVATAKEVLKPASTRWSNDPENVANIIKHFSSIKPKAASCASRMSWIKWFRVYDFDDWSRLTRLNKESKTDRMKTCHACEKGDPLHYPEGMLGKAYCDEHWQYRAAQCVTPSLATDVGILAPNIVTQPQCDAHPMQCHISPCTLCAQGESTIRHYVENCGVVSAMCQVLHIPPLEQAFRPNCTTLDFARLTCALHQVRLLIIRDGLIGTTRRASNITRTPTQSLKELLSAYVKYAHPSLCTSRIIGRAITSNTHSSHSANHGLITAQASPAMMLLKTGKPTTTTSREFKAGDTLIQFQKTTHNIPRLGDANPPLPEPIQGTNPNVQWKHDTNENGENIFTLKATEHLASGTPIVAAPKDNNIPTGKYLLIRFDGSARGKQEEQFCGAGIVIYLASDERLLKEIACIAVPLPQANSPHTAEALAAAKAANEAICLIAYPQYREMQILLQGDNKPIINFWNGTDRLNDPALRRLFQPIITAFQIANITPKWQYIPREHNEAADKLAKIASLAVKDGSYSARTDIHGNIICPHNGEIYAAQDDNTWNQAEAARYLDNVVHRKPNTSPLLLHETYRLDHRVITANIPDHDLITILKFIRQRNTLAEYEAAKGHDELSRHYNRNGGLIGPNMSKRARYLLLADHHEVDIASCFHCIMRSSADGLDNPLLKPTTEAIDYINQNLFPHNVPRAPKVLLQRITTTQPAVVAGQMTREFGVSLSADLTYNIRRFCDSHRNTICERLKQRGFIGHGPHTQVTHSNKAYYCCEAAETAIMASALRNLLSQGFVKSILWLHDGMYVHQSVACCDIRHAFQQASEEHGIPDILIKITKCTDINLPNNDNAPGQHHDSLVDQIHKAIDTQGEIPPGIIPIDRPLGRLRTVFRS
jgi:hypothetical protein